MSTEEKIRTILAEKLNIDAESLTLKSFFIRDLGIDSLDAVELVLTLQDEFGIEVPEDEARTLVSLQDAVCYVEEKLLARNKA